MLLFVIVGCAKEAEKQVQVSNDNFQVELLFTIDDCRVYRFYDRGSSRYFSTCKGSIDWKEPQGKTTIDVTIPTEITE